MAQPAPISAVPTPSRPIWVDARSPSLTRATMCGASCCRLGAVICADAVMAQVCSGIRCSRLAQGLQGADVVHDGPTVFDRDAGPVGRHRALAVGDHFEEL